MENFKMEHFLTHFKRCALPITGAVPNEHEEKKMGQTGDNFALGKFCVWRRSMLMVACPIVFVSMILSFVTLAELLAPDNIEGYNGLGIILICLQEFADLFLLVGVVASVYWWPQIARSTFALRVGWVVAIVAPLLPAFFPLEYIYEKSFLDLFDDSYLFTIKISSALSYAITLLPIVITIPGSAVRASLRVRNLFPNSSLPGWILLISTPFYSLVVLIALVMITQVAGDALLLFGTFLLVAKPWIFMVNGGLFVGVSTPETEKKIQTLLYISLAVGILGMSLIVFWLFTAEVGGVSPIGNNSDDDSDPDATVYLLSWAQGAQLIFEMIGRILVTTVVFCDLVIAMVLRNWSEELKKDDLLGADRHSDCEAFHKALSRKGKDTSEHTKNATEEGSTRNDTSMRNDSETGVVTPAPAPVMADVEQPFVVDVEEPVDGRRTKKKSSRK